MTADSLRYVVDEHSAVLKEHGMAWVAIRGRKISDANVKSLLLQIRAGIPTFLYVVQRQEFGFSACKAKIVGIDFDPPPRAVLPRYYKDRGFARDASLWVQVSSFELTGESELRPLQAATTGNPVLQILSKSMVSVMLVTPDRVARHPNRQKA